MFSLIFIILLEITYNIYKGFYFKNFLMDIILLPLRVIKLIISKSFKMLKEVYKYKLKAEKHKDDKTIQFGTILVENDKIEEAIDFVKSERKEERKQENIKYIFILLGFVGLLFIIYLVVKEIT